MPYVLAIGASFLAYGLYFADSPKLGKSRITKVEDEPGMDNVFVHKGKQGRRIIVGHMEAA